MTLISRVSEAVRGYSMLGNEVFQAERATFVRNMKCRRRHDANFVTDIACETEAEVNRLLARVEREYAAFWHRQFNVDPLTPQALPARFALDAYPFSDQLVMRLEGEPRAKIRRLEVRLVEDDWDDYAALQRADWDEASKKQGLSSAAEITAEFLVSKQCKASAAQFWVAYEDGQPAAFFSSWAAPNGIGVLEDLFTLPELRHRGIASALLAHCAADARRRGAGDIVLSALVDDTPKHMYAAMGFAPLYLQRFYKRTETRG